MIGDKLRNKEIGNGKIKNSNSKIEKLCLARINLSLLNIQSFVIFKFFLINNSTE